MSTQAADTAVRTSVEVQAPVERAGMRTFAERIDAAGAR
jgi:hypothetical protein